MQPLPKIIKPPLDVATVLGKISKKSMFLNLNYAGDAMLEYISLAFNHDCYLIGLSGVPDFMLHLWNWTKGEKLCSIQSGLMVRRFDSKIIYGKVVCSLPVLRSKNII